jgi:hypothetical protein
MGGMSIIPRPLFGAAWRKVAPIAIALARPNRPKPVNARAWIFGKRKSPNRSNWNIMLNVDDRQFQQGYAPIACGLMFAVVGCALSTLLAALGWFLLRGN